MSDPTPEQREARERAAKWIVARAQTAEARKHVGKGRVTNKRLDQRLRENRRPGGGPRGS